MIFVFVQHRRGEIEEGVFNALSQAQKLDLGKIALIIPGSAEEAEEIGEELSSFAHEIILLESPELQEPDSEKLFSAIQKVISEEESWIFLLPHTALGMELAPLIAARFEAPVVSDVLEIEEEGRVALRQFYGGKTCARLLLPPARRRIFTVRQEGRKPQGKAAGRKVRIALRVEGRRRFLGFERPAEDEVDIHEAEVIVGVGRGIGGRENLKLAEELAQALGGVVAGSRPVVDAGWLPRTRQIGLSGKRVQPRLYIALGISGAFQHIAGIRGAGFIVAVNRDPEAPIFRAADVGIVGDLFKVIPLLLEEIERDKRAREGGR